MNDVSGDLSFGDFGGGAGSTDALAVAAPFGIYPGAVTATVAAGKSVVAAYGPLLGGRIYNPATAAEQGIQELVPATEQVTRYLGPLNTYAPDGNVPPATEAPVQFTAVVAQYGPPESLYVSLTGPIVFAVNPDADVDSDFAADFAQNPLVVAPNAIELLPGDELDLPPNFPGDVWVASVTAGHRFSAVVFQPPPSYPPTQFATAFPPSGPVTKKTTIPSYLYKQYQDDDNLQALVAAQNDVTQSYVDAFNALNLPDYTTKTRGFLDWVGAGLYGIPRPTFYSGRYSSTGPLDTVTPNDLPALNDILSTTDFEDVTVTSDDVYKRVLQWHLWRGDGRQVSASWLRRRVVRFLYGEGQQGGANPVSVVSDGSRDLTITIVTGTVSITGGALPGATPLNVVPPDAVSTSATTNTVPALAAVLKEGIDTGALEMPGQYDVGCVVGPVGSATHSTEVLGLEQLLFQ